MICTLVTLVSFKCMFLLATKVVRTRMRILFLGKKLYLYTKYTISSGYKGNHYAKIRNKEENSNSSLI